MSDSDRIYEAVCKFVDTGEIDESEARLIASAWHGGQDSALYAFASTGTILPELEDEIAGTLSRESMEVRALLSYVEKHPYHDQVQVLVEKFTEATGFLCQAGQDNDGQIVLYTGLTLNEDGLLVDMETEEVQPPLSLD